MQKNDKLLNNLNFKLLIYSPLISLFIFCIIVFSIGIKSHIELQKIIPLYQVITKIIDIILCSRDIKFLKNKNAETSEWGWIFIVPIYIFKTKKE